PRPPLTRGPTPGYPRNRSCSKATPAPPSRRKCSSPSGTIASMIYRGDFAPFPRWRCRSVSAPERSLAGLAAGVRPGDLDEVAHLVEAGESAVAHGLGKAEGLG